LQQFIGHTKASSTKQTQPLPTIEPVHYENCLDWVERYYRDIPYLQEQLNQLVAHNSFLERENEELKASVRSNTDRANKRIKLSGNVIIKNSMNFNTITNSNLLDVSLCNI
jgi:regulator of replication initiation timing